MNSTSIPPADRTRGARATSQPPRRVACPRPALHALTLALLLATALLTPVRATAQTPPEPQPSPTPGEAPPLFVLDPMEVAGDKSDAFGPVDGYVAYDSATATKTETPIIETPQSIAVVTRDQMTAQNVQTVAGALRYTASVLAEPYGADSRYDFLFVRGFDQSANGLYLDGLRQQLSNMGFRIEPYGLERIDVLRGPSSVLYGQSAPGGIVNQISKRPRPQPHYELVLEGGSFENVEGAFDVGSAIGDSDWSYRVVSLLRHADTQVDFVPNDRAYVAPSIGWRPTPDTEIVFLTSFLYDDTSLNQYLPPQGTVTFNPNGRIPRSRFVGEPDFNSMERYQVLAGYAASHHVDDTWTLRQNLRFGYGEFSTKAVFGNGFEPDLRTLKRFPYRDDHQVVNFLLDNQAQARWSVDGVEVTSLFGIDLSLFKDDGRTFFGGLTTLDVYAPVYGQVNITTPLPTVDAVTEQFQLGLYTQHQVTLFERLVLLAGGRYDWADSDTNDRLYGVKTSQRDRKPSWRVGVLYLTDFGIAPYGTYATSFEPIEGVDLFGDPFEPSTAESGEIGVKYEPPGWNVLVTAALFDITQSNVLTPDPEIPLNSIQIGEVQSRGGEIEVVATLADGLSAVASYSYADVKNTKTTIPGALGKRPVPVPKELASGWLDYTQPSGVLAGLGVGAGVRYVGPTFGDLENTLAVPGFTLVDAVLHYETGPWRVALNVTNVFDRTYASCYTLETCFYGTARTFLGSVRYVF